MKMQFAHYVVLGAAIATAPATLSAQVFQDPSQTNVSNPNMPTNNRLGSQQTQSQDSNGAPGLTAEEMKDKEFLRRAAAGGIAEVKLGQLAADKGASDDVKAFGAKMVTDHTALNNQMAPIADSDGVRLPKDMTKEDKAEYDKLASLSGDDFDKEYITLMVKDHRKDMREFRQESMSTPDPTLKDAIEKGQTVIREHLKAINKIAADKGIVVPGGRKPPTPQPAPAQ